MKTRLQFRARADGLGCIGYRRVDSPQQDRWYALCNGWLMLDGYLPHSPCAKCQAVRDDVLLRQAQEGGAK